MRTAEGYVHMEGDPVLATMAEATDIPHDAIGRKHIPNLALWTYDVYRRQHAQGMNRSPLTEYFSNAYPDDAKPRTRRELLH
jgi:hypothetical protein